MSQPQDEQEIARRLAEPFAEADVKWRVQQAGEGQRPWVRVLAYIDNAAVMRRLDEVVGVGRWANRFEQFDGGVICGISIAIGVQWVTKYDGSAATQTEPFKGALSGAMKRAAVQWGIGRYLHGMGEQFAEVIEPNDQRYRAARRIKGKEYRWLPPKLDAKYLPARAASSSGGIADAAKTADEEADRQPVIERALRGSRSFKNPMTGDRLVAWPHVLLPGTKAHLLGYGGKQLGEVKARDLPAIRASLTERGGYEEVVRAIDNALADYMGGA